MAKYKALIISILIPLGVGMLAGFLTQNQTAVYQSLVLPDFAPPGTVFPIVWSVLYILMGISAYLVHQSDRSDAAIRQNALQIYAVQLAVNLIWPLIFFSAQNYGAALICILILWILILWMIAAFYKVSPKAAALQIPYLIWVTFAAYLNFAVFMLNQ